MSWYNSQLKKSLKKSPNRTKIGIGARHPRGPIDTLGVPIGTWQVPIGTNLRPSPGTF